MVDTYVDLGTIHAEALIEFKARAQEDRLQILKTLEAQAAADTVVSESISSKYKRLMSEPALHTPEVAPPLKWRILKINGLCLSLLFICQMCKTLKISD